MPTIYCIHCEHACSDRATACPACGHPLSPQSPVEPPPAHVAIVPATRMRETFWGLILSGVIGICVGAGFQIPAVVMVGGLLFALGIVVAPALIAYHRGHKHKQAILVACILIGWSGLGWVLALLWALMEPAKQRLV